MSSVCVRPVANTGPNPLWTRKGRDLDRAVDALRCLCRGEYCRDREVTPAPEQEAA